MTNPLLYLKYNYLNKTQANYFLNKYHIFLKWEKNEEIIDVGSGVGNVTVDCLLPNIPKDFKKLIGVDISLEAISIARSNNSNAKIEFRVFDITANQVPQHFENRFHHVFSFYCLHWVQKQKKAFQNIYKMLKPGGQAFITYVLTSPIIAAKEALKNSDKWKLYFENVQGLTVPHTNDPEKKIRNMLEDVGFVHHACIVEEREYYTFLDSNNFINYCRSVNRFEEYIPNDKQDVFFNDFIKEIKTNKLTEVKGDADDEKITIMGKHMLIFISKKTI